MDDQPRGRHLGEITQIGTWSDIRRSIAVLGGSVRASADWIKSNLDRNEKNLIYFNMLTAAEAYISLAEREVGGPIQALALCTRSIYEMNLRTRFLLDGEQNLEAWKCELVKDTIEVLEGLLTLENDRNKESAAILLAEVQRQKEVARKHGVAVDSKLAQPSELAKQTGRMDEHRALFKLFSKLVHPSSYLINKASAEVHGPDVRNILAVHLQLYAWDMLSRIAKELGVPAHILEPAAAKTPDGL